MLFVKDAIIKFKFATELDFFTVTPGCVRKKQYHELFEDYNRGLKGSPRGAIESEHGLLFGLSNGLLDTVLTDY